MKELSFDEFVPSSIDQWKALVQKELGNKSYESIVWHERNGLVVDPYLSSPPGELWVVPEPSESWDLCQSIQGTDPHDVNARLLQSLGGGANAIGIDCPVNSREELDVILHEVGFEFIAVHFMNVKDPLDLATWYTEKAKELKHDTKTLRGSIQVNSIAAGGQPDLNSRLASFARSHFSLFKTCVIEADRVHNTGGNAVQEIVFALCAGNEFLHTLGEAGISVDDASAMLQFNFATGPGYFLEIAKLRAFRALWKTIAEQYQPEHKCSSRCFVHAQTSRLFRAASDVNTNLLRSTTQAMSAILGGADSVEALPHDGMSESETNFRLARNIQHLLLEESYFATARRAATGSYYIEELTNQLGANAWRLFQEVESRGGLAANKQYFDALVFKSATENHEDLKEGRRVMVGVNKYKPV